jgi:hypothetical protein
VQDLDIGDQLPQLWLQLAIEVLNLPSQRCGASGQFFAVCSRNTDTRRRHAPHCSRRLVSVEVSGEQRDGEERSNHECTTRLC